MRIKKIRLLACLLLMGLVMGYKTPIYAALPNEPVKVGQPAKSLTKLSLTALEEPTPGVPFDSSATIVTAEGVTWDIPVIWVDENGKPVTVPVRGKKYYPAFIFYVPSGYQVSDVNESGMFAISLPDFVAELVGPDGLVFAADPTNGITYMFPAAGVPADISSLLPLPSTSTAPVSVTEEDEDIVDSSDDEDDEEPVIVPYVSAKVRMYCANSAINTLGNEFLEEFIDLLKDTLIPQAANLIRQKFPNSLGSAEPGTELSSNIGLYIYYRTGEILGSPTPESTLAFVVEIADKGCAANIMGLDTSSFTEYDAATGKWKVQESEIANLDNTIVHELLHAFMYDYDRYGMFYDGTGTNPAQRLPLWFIEGLSSSVENDYQYRIVNFLQMGGEDILEKIFTERVYLYPSYTKQNVLSGYLDPYLAREESAAYGFGNPDDAVMELTQDDSAYTSGYLAVAYLGYLDALYNHQSPVDENNNINVDVIRGGIDDILKRLHGTVGIDAQTTDAQSLDEIIYEISGQRYLSTDDFTVKFIKGTPDAQGTYTGDVYDNGSDTGSLAFVSTYLTWLNAQSDLWTNRASNGSIFRQEQDYRDPLDLNWSGSSDVYQITDHSGFSESSVDLHRANLTGGTGSVGNGTQDYCGEPSSKDDEEEMPEQLAAKTENGQAAGEAIIPADDAEEEAANVPAGEQPAGEEPENPGEPAPSSVTEPEAAPATEPAPAADPATTPATEPAPLTVPADTEGNATESEVTQSTEDPAPAIESEPASEQTSDSEPEPEPVPAEESEAPSVTE